MQCPYCRTENRDERDVCYNCKKDLTTLRVVLAKAKQHFNTALEHAERGRDEEAIVELNHALDLDESHVNSHIVLGTLHAKNKTFDKAEAHWRKALSIDPRYEKAHSYLEKLDSVRQTIPLAKRMRVMGLFVALLSIALLVCAFFSLRPDPAQIRFEQIMALSQKPDYAAALAAADEKAPGKDSAFHLPTTLLRQTILTSQTTTLKNIGQQLNEGQLAQARTSINAFVAQNPSIDVKKFLVVLSRRADTLERQQLLSSAEFFLNGGRLEKAHANLSQILAMNVADDVTSQALQMNALVASVAKANVGSCLEGLQEGKTTNSLVSEAIILCRKIGPASPADAEALEEYLAQAELLLLRSNARTQLVALRKGLDEGKISAQDFSQSLTNLRKAQPDNKEVTDVIDEQINTLEKSLNDQMANAIKNADADLATKTLAILDAVLKTTKPDEAQKLIAAWSDKMAASDMRSLINQFDALDNSEDSLEQIVDMGERLMAKDTLSETDRARVERRLKSANADLALKRWEWMETLDRKYETSSLSEADARQTIAWHEQVASHLSRSYYPSSQDNLLFYLAMAYRKVGDVEQELKTLRKIKEDYPLSDVSRYVDEYLEKDGPKASN